MDLLFTCGNMSMTKQHAPAFSLDLGNVRFDRKKYMFTLNPLYIFQSFQRQAMMGLSQGHLTGSVLNALKELCTNDCLFPRSQMNAAMFAYFSLSLSTV